MKMSWQMLRKKINLKQIVWTGSIFLMMLFSCLTSDAQTIVQKVHPHYGITASAHYAVITGYGGGTTGRIGPDIGGFMQIPIQPRRGLYNYEPVHLYIVPQIDFTMMGETNNSGKENINYHFNYIELPIYAKYYIGGFNIVKGDKFFGMLGPVFGFLAGKDISKTAPDYQEIQENTSDLNVGVSIVGGYALPKHLEGFVRVDKGFTNIFGSSNTLPESNQVKIGVGINWIFE